MAALMKVWLWRAAFNLATLAAWLVHFPLRFVAWLSTLAHGWADAAEIEWLLAVAWRRTLTERRVKAAACPVAGVCLGRGDCRDHACPGRGRKA